jgi:hypothetical protein
MGFVCFVIVYLIASFSHAFHQPTSSLGVYRSQKFKLTLSSDLSQYWQDHFGKHKDTKFQIIAGPGMEGLAKSISQTYPKRFLYHETKWGKFPDGTDCIEIGGFQPHNRISGENVLLLASFHNNDVTLSQLSVMITLLESFIESLAICLPFYPGLYFDRLIVILSLHFN